MTLAKEEFTKTASLLHEKEETTTTRTTEMTPPWKWFRRRPRRTKNRLPEGKQNSFRDHFDPTSDNKAADDGECGGTHGGGVLVVKECGTHQPPMWRLCFRRNRAFRFLAVSAEKKKREEQYGANEEDIPDELLWTKESVSAGC